jgi:hypothetical protein
MKKLLGFVLMDGARPLPKSGQRYKNLNNYILLV